jgi:flagellar operon protein
MAFKVINGKIYIYEDLQSITSSDNKSSKPQNTNFKDVLNKAIKKDDSFTISNHAAERLNSRNINLSESDMKKINDGINLAHEKGSNECVLIYKDIAMVASVKNRTLITAVDKDTGKGNIFTNIDSVVLL